LFIGQFEFEFAFLRAQDDRLAFHAPHHVEGRPRFAAQGHLQEIVFDPGFEGLAQLGLNFEEAIRRAQPADALVRALVIVIFDPELDALPRIVERVKLGPFEKLLPDRGPEPLDFAQGHGVMGAGFDMGDAVFAQFGFEARGAPPGGVLPAVVGQHFLGRFELARSDPIDLDDRLGGGAAEQIRRRDEARVIIQEGDEIRILAAQPEGEDIRLPHLVGRGPLEEPRAGEVTRWPRPCFLQQAGGVQLLAHRFRAGLHQEAPAQPLGDALDPEGRVFFLELQDGLGDRRGQLLAARPGVAGILLQARLAQRAIDLHPAREGLLAHAQFLGDQPAAILFLQIQFHGLEFYFERIGRGAFFSAPFSAPLGGQKLLPLRGSLRYFGHGNTSFSSV
jgi:hypothetical protein